MLTKELDVSDHTLFCQQVITSAAETTSVTWAGANEEGDPPVATLRINQGRGRAHDSMRIREKARIRSLDEIKISIYKEQLGMSAAAM